jgi:Arc/MetJ-type ribon-helix-helix transcriptional regulator
LKRERTFPTSIKFSDTLLSKIDEYVEKFNFKDTSSMVRESLLILFDFLDLKENYLKNPENAYNFLKEIEPRLMSQKTQDAFVMAYQNLSKEEQEAIFYQIDQNRKESIIDRRESLKMKQTAILYGHEMEPKIGYVGETYLKNFKKPFYRAVTPEETTEWELMTADQKITLLEDQRNKLITCKSIEHYPHNIQYIERHIDEISKGIEDDSKFKHE